MTNLIPDSKPFTSFPDRRFDVPLPQLDLNHLDEIPKSQWRQFLVTWCGQQTSASDTLVALVSDLRIELQSTKAKCIFLEQEQQKVVDLRILEEKRKLERLLRKCSALRDTITKAELLEMISWVPKNDSYKNHRLRLGLVLLSLTGLRVSNLLLLTVRNLSELLEKKETTISLVKGGAPRHQIRLSPEGYLLLVGEVDSFEFLRKGKKLNDPVFSQARDLTMPISRVKLTTELNTLLKRGSTEFGKFLRSHSFRATFITELLEHNPIHKVRSLVGHKSINSTLLYNRHQLTPQEQEDMLKSLTKLW